MSYLLRRLTLSTLFVLIWASFFASSARAAEHENKPGGITWEKWSDDIFARAKRENKFVYLDLEAVWCHWCHVMDEITFQDPKVIELMKSKYIAVKVDQDSRPDISNRYEDYGWPATVVFNADGGEIVKRSGYIPPGPMAFMLEAIIKDPTPGPSVRPEVKVEYSKDSALPEGLRNELEKKLLNGYDTKEGGWGTVHKFIDWDAVEYEMQRARRGDAEAAGRAKQTLTAALKLIDPVWGGVYQYSTDDDWVHPHFEKIMQFQSEIMRIYAMGFAQFHDDAYLQAARDIRGYLALFLTSPDGAFYVSQDADLVHGEHSAGYFALGDKARRKQGIPRVDTHCYARENGWAIHGLIALYDVTGDSAALDSARRAAEWTLAHRAAEGGGFRHDEHDAAGPYLADTLFVGRGFLDLYAATGDRVWLKRAQEASGFIGKHFRAPAGAGLVTAEATGSVPTKPQIDENVAAVRFLNLLWHYTGNHDSRELAELAMRYLATPQVARSRSLWMAGILLSNEDLSVEPLHITVVGAKADANAAALFRAGLAYPVSYKRIEWWDMSEGPLPHADVEYPPSATAAAFLCTTNTCSSPLGSPDALNKKLAKSQGRVQ